MFFTTPDWLDHITNITLYIYDVSLKNKHKHLLILWKTLERALVISWKSQRMRIAGVGDDWYGKTCLLGLQRVCAAIIARRRFSSSVSPFFRVRRTGKQGSCLKQFQKLCKPLWFQIVLYHRKINKGKHLTCTFVWDSNSLPEYILISVP